MPTYEFRCPAGHDFEQFYRKISDAPLALACPTCGQEAQRRVSAGAGLLFKGSGFYITDYGKDGKKGVKSSDAARTSSSDSAAGGTSEGSGKESAASTDSGGAGSKPTESGSSADKGGSKTE
jgi:putative FmdB family regulatory protein